MDSSLQKIKQPAPSISSGVSEIKDSEGKKFKVIYPPHVDIVTAPRLSATPLADWVEIKRKENPHIIYKLKSKKAKIGTFNLCASLGIIFCALGSISKMFKK